MNSYRNKPMSYIWADMLLGPSREAVLSPEELVQRLHLKKDMDVLELGPGPGFFSIEIARNVPYGSLVLVDIQQEMLDMLRQNLEAEEIINTRLVLADAVLLPLENASFDVAMLALVLGEIPDQAGCLNEIYRVLRPNGLLSLTEQNRLDPDFIPLPKLRSIVEGKGFCLEKTYGDSRNYTANFRKK